MSCTALLETRNILKDSFKELSASLEAVDGAIVEVAAVADRVAAVLADKFGSDWATVSTTAAEITGSIEKFATDACVVAKTYTDNIQGSIIATYANASMLGLAPDFSSISPVSSAIRTGIATTVAKVEALAAALPDYFVDATEAISAFAEAVTAALEAGTASLAATVGAFVASVESGTASAFRRGMTKFVSSVGPDAPKTGASQ